MITEEIEKRLFGEQDGEYRLFQAKLMPGVDPERIIGVRTPVVRKLAKEFAKREEIGDFLDSLPHAYYDENNLHGFILCEEKDYDRAVAYIDAFLPYVDNWATCDLMSPKCFKKNRARLKEDIRRWMASEKTYTVRFGTEMAMSHFLDEDFDEEFLVLASKLESDEYYVNMMTAWYFATALAKQWDAAEPFISGKKLPVWVHNKTIQKAVESYRITDEQKAYLKELKIK